MEKEPYFGSVRFFKHLILTVVALLILIPTGLAIFFGIKSATLGKEKKELTEENEELSDQMELAGQDVEKLQAELKKAAHQAAVAEEKTKEPQWSLLLVNDTHPLDPEYEVELTETVNGQKVDARIAEPLETMLRAMRKAGLRPMVCSGYRTVEHQMELFQNYIEEKTGEGLPYKDAFYKAKTRIAAPGTSEHQTGLAVDIVGKSHQALDSTQKNTKEAKWLLEHCAEYGFILRYPEGKADVTGVDYESWHFRYVGEEAAGYIMENDITLEEYLEIFY